jgi:uncharacterized protein YegL
MNNRLAIGIAVALGVAAAGRPGLTAEPAAAGFAAARTRALAIDNDATASAAKRCGLLAELAEFPTADAVRLVVRVGFLGPADPTARSAAREALVRLNRHARPKAHMLAEFHRQLGRPGTLAIELALVMLAAEPAGEKGGFRDWLDRQAAPAVATAVCGGVCQQAVIAGDTTAIAALRALAGLRCCTSDLACRRAVIRALVTIHRPASVGALVDLLATLRGEARGDVVAYLTAVSGERHGADADGWRTWYEARRADLVLPEPRPAYSVDGTAPAAGGADASVADYYGIPIYADRVVFVLDTSSSMEGPPLEAAKRELESAIAGLPETTAFTVLAFNSGVAAWQRQLVPATDEAKAGACGFIIPLPAAGGTATCDALEAAFGFDTEAIFLLSDGAPSRGRITDPEAIVRFVAGLNGSRCVSVHAISIMGGAAFLERLAELNNGTFREVAD